jgi:RHS repeat-associated protein
LQTRHTAREPTYGAKSGFPVGRRRARRPGDDLILKHDDKGSTLTFGPYVERVGQHWVKSYWGGDRLLARRTDGGTLRYYHQDRLGSTRLITDDNANLVQRNDYTPLGQPLTPPLDDDRLWTGRRTDHDTGLIDMNARNYDPELGQFISPDSILPDPFDPESLNRYAYVGNNFPNYGDPSGHMKMSVDMRKDQQAQYPFQISWYQWDQTRCGGFQ